MDRTKSHGEQPEIAQKSSHIGMVSGLLVCLILVVINMITHRPWQDLLCAYCAAVCGQYAYKWFRTRDLTMLIFTVLWGIVSAALFIWYLLILNQPL